ncbi:MAG TPA: Ppx/GppA phosphatase family protein [Caulobacteraceae bacterium]|jgi:exopolyphosphatase/guanosine-5'-triphosphate,3'-diphosphate pyrophosphatase|nr:Ppx/GppA phosphatase family protein [Caulobacteraceae bacterium]
MSAIESRPGSSDAAVIDVGSNSVRLVLYRLDGRAIWSVFNEKVLAGLGRDIARTGALSPDGVTAALTALRRFSVLIEASRPSLVFAAATAAVREATDGRQFCERVEAETGIKLRVLSGEEEAQFAALGVLGGAPQARGLVGDLGGASLELLRLDGDASTSGITLPLGPFSIPQQSRFEATRVRMAVERVVSADIRKAFRADTLNAVGGAWRNLALLHMRISDYPLEILHQYEIGWRDVLDLARLVSLQSRSSLERIEGISKRRLENLPHAAVVLEGLVERLDIQRVSLSAFGVREGLLLQSMAEEVRRRDPLLAGCAALGARAPVAEALGKALDDWVLPAFERLPPMFGARERTLISAVTRLAEFGSTLHPDHRADLVFEHVLRAPLAGLDHHERAFLACAAFSRHTASSSPPRPQLISRLLSPERHQRARALGAAVRLGCELSGRNPELLARSRLTLRPGVLSLEAEDDWAPLLLGEQTAKRAATLAALLDREPRLRPMGARARTVEAFG